MGENLIAGLFKNTVQKYGTYVRSTASIFVEDFRLFVAE